MTLRKIRSSRAQSRDVIAAPNVSQLRSTRTGLGVALGMLLAAPAFAQTVAPRIGSDPSPSATVPLVMAKVCAASGAALASSAAAKVNSRIT